MVLAICTLIHKQTIRFIALLFLCNAIFIPSITIAQQQPLSLIADSIHLNQSTGTLVASGHVQITFAGSVLSAGEIRYNSRTGNITASGPIIIREKNGNVITAEYIDLDKSLQDGIILGARILLNNQLQIAASEARRSAGRFNTMTNIIASSCRICADQPTPVWQIRAQRIIHDEEARQIYFRNAEIEILGLTLPPLPYLRIPSPGVTRSTGLLSPSFLSSGILGNGLRIPYYITLGDHADATLTSTLTLEGAFIADAEYRKVFSHGEMTAFGAVALLDPQQDIGRGFFRTHGTYDIGRDFTLNYNATLVSDNGFMKRFGYNDTDRVVSEISASRYNSNNYFSIAGAIMMSLRDDEDNDKIPVVFPEFTYRNYTVNSVLGGKYSYEINGVGLMRRDGQNVARIGGKVAWARPFTLPNGIRASTFTNADLDIYKVWDTGLFPTRPLVSFHPTIGADIRWPLAYTTSKARHIFEPIVQLVYTPNITWNDTVPNEDSLQVEFDETNLFHNNRYPGRDASELGFRANIGATYTIENTDSWNLGIAGGVVLRSDTTSQFSQDFLGSINLEFPPHYTLTNRFLFDENLTIKRAEVDFDTAHENWNFGGTFVYLSPDPLAGSSIERGEGTIRGQYRFSPNWEFDMNWTRDFVSGKSVTAGAGLNYGNECIQVELSLTRRFTTSLSVPATTNFGLVIQLAGFGGNSQDRWSTARCAY